MVVRHARRRRSISCSSAALSSVAVCTAFSTPSTDEVRSSCDAQARPTQPGVGRVVWASSGASCENLDRRKDSNGYGVIVMQNRTVTPGHRLCRPKVAREGYECAR